MMPQNPNTLEVEWKKSAGLVPYEQAVEWMERRVAQIIAGEALEVIWLLEHPPLYTAGTSSDEKDLIDPNRFPVFKAQRGGQYTYHGPGQRVIYVILDVAKRGRDIRKFVKNLEIWVINTLAKLNVVRSEIPAITHVDYSARIQSVNRKTNPRYHEMLTKFNDKYGCPVIVNTSFNVRGEPIVCTPKDAYLCFMRTEMDYLIMENYLLNKSEQTPLIGDSEWQSEFELD